MRRNPTVDLNALADRLLAWSKTSLTRGTVRDVYAWVAEDGTPTLALVGDPRKLETGLGGFEEGRLNNRSSYFEARLGQALGVKQRHDGRSVTPQFMDEGLVGPYQLLEGIGRMATDVLGVDQVDATMIPDPGRPHTGARTTYYSAATRKSVTVGLPAWLTTGIGRDDAGREVQAFAADYCKLAARLDKDETGDAWFRLGNRDLLVTHSMDFARGGVPVTGSGADAHIDATAAAVGGCNGLLFPSLAVGEVPASNFGPCTLIIDPYIVLRALAPFRKPRTTWPVVVYNTDAWTETTREFVNQYAVELYNELTGRGHWLYSPHFYVTGPRLGGTTGFSPEAVRALGTLAQLKSVTERRSNAWAGATNPMKFQKVWKKTRESRLHRYNYLEAKAAAIVGVGAWTGAACADFAVETFGRFLSGVGYRGTLVVVGTSDAQRGAFLDQRNDNDEARYNFAWAMRERVIAELPGLRRV